MLGALLESSEASCGFEIVKTLFAKQNSTQILILGTAGDPAVFGSASGLSGLVKEETSHISEMHSIPDCLAFMSETNPD